MQEVKIIIFVSNGFVGSWVAPGVVDACLDDQGAGKFSVNANAKIARVKG